VTRTLEATYDGVVLRLKEPLDILPNSIVRVTIESPSEQKPESYLDVAMALNLDGPPDWSENLEHYLYGREDKQ
jgi:hypothetical protein